MLLRYPLTLDFSMLQGYYSDLDGRRRPRKSIELPPLNFSNITSDPFFNRPREILPSLLAASPPGRSSTLPPLQRPLGPSRPRKQSISKKSRESLHKKKPSRGSAADWLRRIQNEERIRPGGHDRKALSAEPSADYGKRWEDLIDAADQAASAAGDVDEDRTPMPQSPVSIHRASLPPFSHHHFQPASSNYQASPLQQALTPPLYNQDVIEPFPSVESGESGENFHIGSRGLSDSSPSYNSQNIQIYCAACHGISLLKNSYACTECICGLCSTCVEVLMSEHGARRKCPRCATIGGRYKPFQLDITFSQHQSFCYLSGANINRPPGRRIGKHDTGLFPFPPRSKSLLSHLFFFGKVSMGGGGFYGSSSLSLFFSIFLFFLFLFWIMAFILFFRGYIGFQSIVASLGLHWIRWKALFA
ncbi:hypothetical protein V8C37DRAFT_166367 [Trichoderma ceciliae]